MFLTIRIAADEDANLAGPTTLCCLEFWRYDQAYFPRTMRRHGATRGR
jgi:hypothetical protein